MKHLKKFNESINHNKVNDFISMSNSIINYDESEYEQGDEPSNIDILSELGDLYNDLDMTKEELELVIKSRRVSDVAGMLKILLDEVINEQPDSVVRNENSPIEKVVVYYRAYDAGDGGVGVRWFMNEDDAWDITEGEPAVDKVETYVGSNVYKMAKNNER